MVEQELYSIEFFDNERNFMPYCYFELYINSNLVTGLPPRADSQGKILINKQWVESTLSAPKELMVSFWNSTFPKTQHSETERFIWPEGKTSIKVFLPDVYTINTRSLENENNEEQDYQRAYYLVRKGDTWLSLETELGFNTVEALMFHNRMKYSDSLIEGQKLYYPLGFRTRNMVASDISGKKRPQSKEEGKVKPSRAPKAPDKKIEQPKKTKESEKSSKKEDQKKDSLEKENTIEQRSQANGKPIEVAQPKKDGCCCYRDITVDEFNQIITNKKAADFLNYLNDAFKTYGINTCIGKAFFIANSLHETSEYKFLEEILAKGVKEENVYDGYKGRGIMQLTWADNYKGYGISVGEDFLNENKVRIATERKHAVGSGAWFWRSRGLDQYALKNDLITISALINGGYNHFDDRAKYYRRSINSLSVKSCKNIDNKIILMLDNYIQFEDSEVYHNSKLIGECFGWGLWNDPGVSKKGKSKNIDEAKKGYKRFLEMAESKVYPFGFDKKRKREKKRYGYKGSDAVIFAKERMEKL